MTTDLSPQGLYFPTDITPEQLFKAMGKLRRAARDEIERLISFLDSTSADADDEDDVREPSEDDEPSLGFSSGGYLPEIQWQEGRAFHMNADGGTDLEDEHCGAEPEDDSEPDVDGEYSLGWGTGDSQTGQWSIVTDLEEGVGAVRKKRPASKTGGRVLVGIEVFR